MSLLLYTMPGNEGMARQLAELLPAEPGQLLVHRFPDEETYLRVASNIRGREAALVCTLNEPDAKLTQLLFASDLLRELGSKRIGLIAPYLAYMRQDCRFKEGEAITSKSFARQISACFDWLVTVDPHLHRYASLDELYSIPTAIAHASPLLGDWVGAHVINPLLVGPDSESDQWVRSVAARARAPHITLTKHRIGDRQVRIHLPDLGKYRGCTPVLIDDIVSSGTTLLAAAHELAAAGFAKPVCLIVHALCKSSDFDLLRSVTSQIISSDTIPHSSNGVAVAEPLTASIRQMVGCFS